MHDELCPSELTDTRLDRSSAVGVPRARASRGSAGRPRFHDGALGPTTLSSLTAPAPISSSIRASIDDASRRIWVAQAVESARTVSTPSTKVSGSTWPAMSGPTISGHRPITEPTATSTFHPRSSSRRSSWSPSSAGSRPSRDDPDSTGA